MARSFRPRCWRETGLKLWVDRRRRRGAAVGAGRASGLARCQGHRLRHRRQLDGTGADRRRQGRQARVDPAWPVPAATGRRRRRRSAQAHIDRILKQRCQAQLKSEGERIYLVGGIVAGDRPAGHGAAELSADRAARIPHDARRPAGHAGLDRDLRPGAVARPHRHLGRTDGTGAPGLRGAARTDQAC